MQLPLGIPEPDEHECLTTRSTGALLLEVSKRLPEGAEIKLKNNVVRIQKSWDPNNLTRAEDIDNALITNFALFG